MLELLQSRKMRCILIARRSSRHVFATVPPSVEYRLTAMGGSLLTPLMGLMTWADANHAAIRAARAVFAETQAAEV